MKKGVRKNVMLKNNSKFEIPEVYGDIKKGYTYIIIQPNRTLYVCLKTCTIWYAMMQAIT